MSDWSGLRVKNLVATIVVALLVATGWFLFLSDSWTTPSIFAASHSLLAYLAIMCSGFILVEYRIQEESEQTIFHAALFFVAVISIVRAIRVILFGDTLSSPDSLLNMLTDLNIFGVILIIGVLRRRTGGPRNRTLEVVLLVLGGLAAQILVFVLWPSIDAAYYPAIGLVLGISAAGLISSSGLLWGRVAKGDPKFNTSKLIAGFTTYSISWIPVVYALYYPSSIWTISFALRGVGLILIVLSASVPFFLRSGSKRTTAYIFTFGLQMVAILPLFITETAIMLFPTNPAVGTGVYIVLSLGAAVLACFTAFLTATYNSQRFSMRRYPIIALFLVWGCVDAYQAMRIILSGAAIVTATVVPYTAGAILTLLLLPCAVRWTRSEPNRWVVENRRILVVLLLVNLMIDIWIGETVQNVVLGTPAGEPYARILILACMLFVMFAFVYHVSYLMRESRGRLTVDLFSIGFLLPWIVPSLIRASYGEASVGWGLADLLLLLTTLVGPAFLGAMYLGEMRRAENQKTKAKLYADLLVHDITNYHQALELGLGLIARDGVDVHTQKHALRDAYRELQRADRLIRNVRRLGMAEEIDPTKLREIDLALVVEAAYNMAARNSDGGNRVLLDMDAQPGQYKARGSNLLIDALVNVFESSMTNAEAQNTIRVEIANSEQSGDGYWDLLILNENRNVDPNHVQDLLERGFEAKSGTGLGLSVTKMLVEAIGGRVTVSTRQQNAGLRFSVTLAKV